MMHAVDDESGEPKRASFENDRVVRDEHPNKARCYSSRVMTGYEHLLVIGLLLLLIVFLLFRLLLLLFLEARNCDAVEVSHAILANPSATLGVLLEHSDRLESLNNLSLNRTGRLGVLCRSESSVGSATVEFSERTDTDRLSEVDVAGEGSCKWETRN